MGQTDQQIEHVVPAEQAGQRFDQVLATLESVGSRAEAARLIDTGAATIDGIARRKSRLVAEGEAILLTPPEPGPPPSEVPEVDFGISYEDEDLLVIDKPAGLVVHPGPGNRSGTLSQALAGIAGGGDPERPGIVHRLDKDTSGLMIVARNDDALRRVQRALQEREVARTYTALVVGRPESSTGTIDAPLGRDRREPEKVSVRSDSPRPAVTHFETIEQVGGRTLLRVQLETGRTHQIRVHLAAIGLPVCGDLQYGVAGDLGLERQFLHASALSFDHPRTGERLELESGLPSDLADALGRARDER
jgi:23S rRNA pseudouridine1911/1915/1917 synthase